MQPKARDIVFMCATVAEGVALLKSAVERGVVLDSVVVAPLSTPSVVPVVAPTAASDLESAVTAAAVAAMQASGWRNGNRRGNYRRGGGNGEKFSGTCFRCQKNGHKAQDCHVDLKDQGASGQNTRPGSSR